MSTRSTHLVCSNPGRAFRSSPRPPLPAATQRQLEWEAGYNCANHSAHPDPKRFSGPVEIHHITPWRIADALKGTPHDPSNLIALCGVCHRRADDQEPEMAPDFLQKLKHALCNDRSHPEMPILVVPRTIPDAMAHLLDAQRKARNLGRLSQHGHFLKDIESASLVKNNDILMAKVKVLRAETLRLLKPQLFWNARTLLNSAREIGSRVGPNAARGLLLADVSYNLGYLSYLAGEYPDAIRNIEESGRLAAESGDTVRAYTCSAIALVAKVRDGATTVANSLEDHRKVFEDNQHQDHARDWCSSVLIDEADICLRMAERLRLGSLIDRAFRALDGAEEYIKKSDDPSAFTSLYRFKGLAHLLIGEHERAAELLTAAQLGERRYSLFEGRAKTARDLGRALKVLGSVEDAHAMFLQGLSLPRDMDNGEAQDEISHERNVR